MATELSHDDYVSWLLSIGALEEEDAYDCPPTPENVDQTINETINEWSRDGTEEWNEWTKQNQLISAPWEDFIPGEPKN